MVPAERLSESPVAGRVLLVEDEPVIRTMLGEELRAVGLRVVEASNADEAWSYLEAGGQVDLVVSDIVMPGSMDGAELMSRVMRTYPRIKRVITSAYPGKRSVAELGVFLTKPYRLEAVAKLALDMLGLDAP